MESYFLDLCEFILNIFYVDCLINLMWLKVPFWRDLYDEISVPYIHYTGVRKLITFYDLDWISIDIDLCLKLNPAIFMHESIAFRHFLFTVPCRKMPENVIYCLLFLVILSCEA